MSGQAVIDAYHDLWQVEKSFRMAKSDLRARPIFHRQRDAIEAHRPSTSTATPWTRANSVVCAGVVAAGSRRPPVR
ncbi:hypothetical protein CFP66_40570 [Pseudonocardia sp. MH-G8]|nr:hypothetical protein CFP66_40570 [Pseudonocardia sp. MH-G8]